jgi:hypothetical protein
MEDEDLLTRLTELQEAITRPGTNAFMRSVDGFLMSPDADLVIAWFKRELPRCMALVPGRRHTAFLRGVYQYAVEEENNLTEF